MTWETMSLQERIAHAWKVATCPCENCQAILDYDPTYINILGIFGECVLCECGLAENEYAIFPDA